MPHEIYVDWAAAYPEDAKHFVPLYTRPAPLSDEQIAAIVLRIIYCGGVDSTAHREAWTREVATPLIRGVERELFEGE